MTDLVVDASALVLAVVGRDARADDVRGRLLPAHRHAPHLVDAETGSVLRRQVERGEITAREGGAALTAAGLLVESRYAHTGALASAAWAHRDNLSFYDALYVALAAELGIPLLTADARITRAPRLGCEVQLV